MIGKGSSTEGRGKKKRRLTKRSKNKNTHLGGINRKKGKRWGTT